MSDTTHAALAKDLADWLVDAVATATQNRHYLRGDPEADGVAIDAILLNGEKAIRVAIDRYMAALRTARPDVAALLAGEAVAVPREATDAMLWAADKEPYPVGVQDNPDMSGFVSFALVRAEYRAMLAASPWSKRDE